MMPASVEEFARDPVGKFHAGDRFVHFCYVPKLWGLVLWGQPTEADTLDAYRSLLVAFQPPAVPHALLIDASRLEGGESAAFARVERFIAKYAEPLRAYILRLALVRPRGLAGAMVAGAPLTLPFPHPVSVFDEVAAALEWLAPTAGLKTTTEIAAELARAEQEASKTPEVLRRLRIHLDAHLEAASLAAAARALALSERSLQRRLADAGTTLQDELSAARVRVAQRLLTNPANAMSDIAATVGCGSLSHFSTLFKKMTGVTPSAWRKQHSSS